MQEVHRRRGAHGHGAFGGALKSILANELGVVAVKEALRRSGLQELGLIEDVLIGNCMMRTDKEINVARVIGLKARVPSPPLPPRPSNASAPPECRPSFSARRKSGCTSETEI